MVLCQRHIFYVLYVGCTIHVAYHCDDVQLDGEVDAVGLDVMIDGYAQTLQLLVVDSIFRICKETVATGLNLYKHHGSVII